MRVFKFWNIAETTVLIDGVEKSISCFGGSNHSESENREVSGGFIMKHLRDSAGIIPIILLILVAIVALFILLRIISC